MSVLFFIKGPR